MNMVKILATTLNFGWILLQHTRFTVALARRNFSLFNPFAPGDFAEKRVLKLVEWFSGHCRAKGLKLTTNRFTGRTLRGLLIQMQNISLRSSGMRRKQNFDTFRFLSSLLFSLFLPHFFFLLLAFSRLQFGGKSF